MIEILKGLFGDIFIVIASITLGNLIYRDHIKKETKASAILTGFLCGIMGLLLMLYKVKITGDMSVDFRCIPMMIMGIYGSFLAALITTAVIALFQIVLYGCGAGSLLWLAATLLMGAACVWIGKTKFRAQIKWTIACFAMTLITGGAFLLTNAEQTQLGNATMVFCLGLVFTAAVTYLIKTFNLESNNRYFMIERASHIDFLTGLHNVRHYDETLNDFMDLAKRTQTNLSVLFIDIDFFKKVNDTYGHLNGDRVLQELGNLLLSIVKENDVVTRKGGDEFTMLFHGKLEEALRMAERIRGEAEAHEFLLNSGGIIHITVSIGVSSYPETTNEEDKLSEQADIALYQAKRSGRNQVCTVGWQRPYLSPLTKTDR